MAVKQPKTKITDLAKELGKASSEIADIFKANGFEEKKTSASLTNDETNLVLEIFTQQNQVENFEAFFAAKTTATAAPKQEKSPLKSLRQIIPKVKPQAPQKPKPAPKPAAPEQKAEPVRKMPVIKPVPAPEGIRTEAVKPRRPEQPAPAPVRAKPIEKEKPKTPPKFNAERFNTQSVLNKTDNKKKAVKTQEVRDDKRVQLSTNLAETGTVQQKVHNVDTRGSYVEIDKYNERYENIAPATQVAKKSETERRKQKIVQQSQQRKKQQYSSKHETDAQKMRRLELERARKQQLRVHIPDEIVVSELAARLKVNVTQVIKQLIKVGVMASMNEVIDFDTASLISEELGAKVEREVILTIEDRLIVDNDDNEGGEERPPVVVVMGHVDHGKTSLLDNIRKANVVAGEAGGITQHIGAYTVTISGKTITFLDTPGHAAFTSMRARGASITDIAILVVAADDGIMPQTIEAINHAKAANVPVIVAINKMDKEAARPEVIKQQLTEHGLVIEEWGGDVICVPVSAKTGEGIDSLLEQVLVVAEVAELKANPNRAAKGAVIEARLDKGRGPIATLLIQNGTLQTGNVIIAGTAVGRVRVMTDDKGNILSEAGPSQPVEITGLAEVPAAGDIFNAVADERLARELVEERRHRQKQEQFAQYQKVTLDNLFSQIEQGSIKELPIIVKADVQGSVEAVRQSLEKLSNEEVRVKVIHGAVGAVSESDVMLADASNAIIVGFNVRPDPIAEENAKRDGVEIRLYRIIYDAIEEVETAMKGLLAPKFREVQFGRAEVRQVYKITGVGQVAGSYILSGKIMRNNDIRIVRDGVVIAEDKISSLKRFKDDAKEVAEGYECGITLDKFNDIKTGDILEGFTIEEIKE
ncbi:MAG: translation initiation factor IF-2 [Ruminococcus sp.]|jgi:translation initiation factor IF-2|nr:translation initiation factor IF-2 [Ruminococcus sp.]